MPNIPNYPEKGILQFYIAYEEKDDVLGINFDDLTEQTSFRVFYHENIINDLSVLQNPPEIIEWDESYFPFTGEFLLTGIEKDCYMTPNDYRFNDLFVKKLNELTGMKIKNAWDLSEANYDKVYEELGSGGHKIGGYPFFTQEDPRDYKVNYDSLLLQIDSQFDNDYEIIWGDAGVANFFIKLDDLKKLDFSNVMYTWDCY